MKDHGKHMEDSENEGRLFQMPKKQPFDIPEGYFEKLPLKIQERIRPEESSVWKQVLGFILRPLVAVPVCAALILILIGITYYNRSLTKESREIAVLKLEKTDVQDMEEEKILAPISSIKKEEIRAKHTEQLAEDMIIEEIASEEEEIIFPEEALATTSAEEINYLLDHDIDVSIILDELQKN